MPDIIILKKIFDMVVAERNNQFETWGDQHLPIISPSARYISEKSLFQFRIYMERIEKEKTYTWHDITFEEFLEFFSETDKDKQIVEGIQLIAVLFQILESDLLTL